MEGLQPQLQLTQPSEAFFAFIATEIAVPMQVGLEKELPYHYNKDAPTPFPRTISVMVCGDAR